jgi:hypothetical protein
MEARIAQEKQILLAKIAEAKAEIAEMESMIHSYELQLQDLEQEPTFYFEVKNLTDAIVDKALNEGLNS